jgi:hypothetical protein
MNNHLQYFSCLPSMDVEYRFGRPKLYLAPHELARLTILRSKLGETRAERAAESIHSGEAAEVARTSAARQARENVPAPTQTETEVSL